MAVAGGERHRTCIDLHFPRGLNPTPTLEPDVQLEVGAARVGRQHRQHVEDDQGSQNNLQRSHSQVRA